MPTSVKQREILLVEDNPADATLFQMALREVGDGDLHVSCVSDGREALDFLYQRAQHTGAPRPDIIFLDLNLPIVDGREVLEKAKNDADLGAIPIVILSTSGAHTDIAQSYKRGANAYMVKPADLNAFFRMVQTCREF